jgi:hypothetical protein
MNTDAVILAHERQFSTTDERQVLALEMIADQLGLVVEGLTRIGKLDSGDSAAVTDDADRRAGDRWENEGGQFQPDLTEAPEIERTLVEHFAVGGYNYTNLEHAIAEAKRARRARTG